MDVGSLDSQFLKHASRVADMADARAMDRDRQMTFPQEEVAALAHHGLLSAVLPTSLGGVIGSDERSGLLMLRLLHRLGRGSLALGRVFEAHVNALRLVMRYGHVMQREEAASEAQAGKLFALWVTDTPDAGLRITGDGALSGAKSFCSAAGYVERAVVTAAGDDGGAHMLLLSLQRGERVLPAALHLQGMRAATTGEVDFTGCAVDPGRVLGQPGDYLREPEFSTGAWRGSAVALGGLAKLLDAMRAQLRKRGRDGDPHQRARFGRAVIAYQTGWLWLERTAQIVQAERLDPAHSVAYTNLARSAVEAACLEAMQLAQRSLGLAAFIQSNPVERLLRDLSTYLRQPAPDEALDEAAAFYFTHGVPDDVL